MEGPQHDDVVQTLGQAPVIAVAAPEIYDPVAEDDPLDIIEQLLELESAPAERQFDGLEELFAAEERETLGVPVEWPALKGAVVNLAHFSSAVDKKEELERVYRERKKLQPREKLDARVEERLWREALFGTVVKGWSQFALEGKLFPFNLQNYRRLMQVRRFRMFVLEKARDAETFRERRESELRGNLPAASSGR